MDTNHLSTFYLTNADEEFGSRIRGQNWYISAYLQQLALSLSCHRFGAKLPSREIGKTIRFRASLVKNDFSPRKSVMTVSFGAQHSHRVELFRASENISFHSVANTLLFFCSSFFTPLLKTVPNMTWQSLPSSTRTWSKRQTAPPPYPRVSTTNLKVWFWYARLIWVQVQAKRNSLVVGM